MQWDEDAGVLMRRLFGRRCRLCRRRAMLLLAGIVMESLECLVLNWGQRSFSSSADDSGNKTI